MQTRIKLEEERRALAAFVSKFDSLGLASSGFGGQATPPLSLIEEAFDESSSSAGPADVSPVKITLVPQPSLLEEDCAWDPTEEVSFETEKGLATAPCVSAGNEKTATVTKREVLAEKENIMP
jgi:centromeric protein E